MCCRGSRACLTIAGVPVDDDALREILDGLRVNTSLTSLSLRGACLCASALGLRLRYRLWAECGLTDDMTRSLVRVLRDSSCLTSINLARASCVAAPLVVRALTFCAGNPISACVKDEVCEELGVGLAHSIVRAAERALSSSLCVTGARGAVCRRFIHI